MIHPLIAISSIALTFAITFGIFMFTSVDVEEYFFINILILISIYTLVALVRDKESYWPRRWLQNPIKVIGKYVFWGGITYVAKITYTSHSFYTQAFSHAEYFLNFYFDLYLWAGLPYFVLAEKFRYTQRNFLSDPYLRILSLFRQVFKRRWSSLKRVYRLRAYKTFVISSFLRLHFLPLMVDQIYFTNKDIATSLGENTWTYTAIVAIMTSFVWTIDANNASIGYFWESVFTKTRFKAMDTNPIHWLVTMICYMPFTIWATTFLPALMDHNQAVVHIIDGTWFEILTDIIGLVFLAGYISSGASLYFSTSNMTYKAIQTRGPYALIRHPATFCKVGFFGIATFKFAAAYTAINIFAYVLWTGIYIARTICEERFLSQFEEYRDYQQKTRYRLIPGLW
ncbi:MAG: hypothetical protein KDD43_04100 [Bdellovibrionales bacterium]|nr:hypothetical protein [Bdellovibrionales bacterium]